MKMPKSKRTLKKIALFLLIFIILVFGLPNIFNTRERAHFTADERLAFAQSVPITADTIVKETSTFYKRGGLVETLFGKHYRNLWGLPVKFPVFHGFDSLEFEKIGGGMQTISVEFENQKGQHYSFRSVDKDQSSVLPGVLHYSVLRPLLRDQASALNPFAAPVTSYLANAAGIIHTSPKYYFIPLTSDLDTTLQATLSGRIVLLEREFGGSWEGNEEYNSPKYIWNTKELIQGIRQNKVELDTSHYLKCRLFDFMISDWDRHGGQWKWMVYNQKGKMIARAVPIDRDMAFCRFDDGLINEVVINSINRFQSFRSDPKEILDITNRVYPLDSMFLAPLEKVKFIEESEKLKALMSDSVIKQAISQYREEVPKEAILDQRETLRYRRDMLLQIAESFSNNLEDQFD